MSHKDSFRAGVQAIERDMRGRKVKVAGGSRKSKGRRQCSGYFRIARPDTGFTAGDMSLEVCRRALHPKF